MRHINAEAQQAQSISVVSSSLCLGPSYTSYFAVMWSIKNASLMQTCYEGELSTTGLLVWPKYANLHAPAIRFAEVKVKVAEKAFFS